MIICWSNAFFDSLTELLKLLEWVTMDIHGSIAMSQGWYLSDFHQSYFLCWIYSLLFFFLTSLSYLLLNQWRWFTEFSISGVDDAIKSELCGAISTFSCNWGSGWFNTWNIAMPPSSLLPHSLHVIIRPGDWRWCFSPICVIYGF